jgi:hypothetical protein
MSTTTPAPAPIGRSGARFARGVIEPDESRPVLPAASAVGRTGARFPHAATVEEPTEARGRDGATFGVVMRGYDRGEVDAFIRRRAAQEEQLRAALGLAERRRDEAVAHAEATQAENDRLLAATPPAAGGEAGFGARAERVLRLAESEAADVRTRAARDAVELGERARRDAQAQRHAVQQELLARAAELEEEAARRAADLQAREDRVVRQAASMRAEADRVTAAAARDADRLRAEAEAMAEAVRARLDEELGRCRQEAAGDLERLQRLREEARAALRRLADVVTAQLVSPGMAERC